MKLQIAFTVLYACAGLCVNEEGTSRYVYHLDDLSIFLKYYVDKVSKLVMKLLMRSSIIYLYK